MNSLIVLPGEGWDSGKISIVGPRALELFRTHEFELGQEIHVALLGGEKGLARVVSFEEAHLELSLISRESSSPLRPIDLIVGLSRPQTVKKVIQAATMVGVRSLHFVHTETGEKSYLTSHILEPESLQLEVIKSLEQVWEGLYPEIRVHRSFAYFVRNHLVKLAGSETTTRLIASPGAGVMDRAHMKQGGSAMVIAVGSEGGWSTQERGDFQTHGFDEVGLGARIVRVEVALTMLLGQAILFGSVGD